MVSRNIDDEKFQKEKGYIISSRDLCKRFIYKKHFLSGRAIKYLTAVNNINLSISKGEVLGLIGESGSGKSTLGEIIADLQKATSGQIFFLGKNICLMSKKEYNIYRRNVQIVFQDPKGAVNPYFKIKSIIAEPLSLLGITSEQKEIEYLVDEMLEKVALDSTCKDRYPAELSGGQCQRVAIARALIVHPELLICDEPVSALDVSIQTRILNLLKGLQKEMGMAYLFISHDPAVVNFIADRVMVMKDGQIVEEGDREKIFFHPEHSYTKELLSSYV